MARTRILPDLNFSFLPRFIKILGFIALSLVVLLDLLFWRPSMNSLHDWGSFIDSGLAATRGQNPYLPYAMANWSATAEGFRWAPNLNPPILLPAFQLAALFDPRITYLIWVSLSFVFYFACIGILLRTSRYSPTSIRILVLLAFAGLWQTVENGQVYIILLLLVTGIWILFERGHGTWAAVLIGITVALKVNLALWPVLLFIAGHRRIALVSTFAALAASFAPLPLYGPTVYGQWLEGLRAAPISILTNTSIPYVMLRLGLPQSSIIVSAILIAILACWAWRIRPEFLDLSGPTLGAALLASPIAWIGYSVILLPAVSRRKWDGLLGLGMLLFCIPHWSISSIPGIWAIYPVGMLCLVGGLALYSSPALALVPDPKSTPS